MSWARICSWGLWQRRNRQQHFCHPLPPYHLGYSSKCNCYSYIVTVNLFFSSVKTQLWHCTWKVMLSHLEITVAYFWSYFHRFYIKYYLFLIVSSFCVQNQTQHLQILLVHGSCSKGAFFFFFFLSFISIQSVWWQFNIKVPIHFSVYVDFLFLNINISLERLW